MQLFNVNGGTADQGFKDKLNVLMTDVFGFSFQTFHELGVWGTEYEYFSLIDEERMVANIGVYTMEMLLKGKPQRMAQLGAVAVAEDRRGEGLSRTLFMEVLDKYPDIPMYLYAGDDVVAYYEKFGFREAAEYQPVLATKDLPITDEPDQANALRRIDITEHAVDAYLRERRQYSSILACQNGYGVNWFHLAYFHQKHVYELPGLGALVVAETQGNKLLLQDAWVSGGVRFADLWPALRKAFGEEEIEEICFGFTPDFLDVETEPRRFIEEDSHLMVRGWEPEQVGGFLERLTRT